MATSLLLISCQLAGATLSFNFSSPSSQVEINESFSVVISAETSSTYDVKIFVNNDSRANSEILSNGEWKNPYYYLTGVFPSTTQFTLRAFISGDYLICARLRETGKSAYSENCNNITIIENPNPPQEPEPEPENNSIANTTQNNSENQSASSADDNETSSANISRNNNPLPVQTSQASSQASSSQDEDNDIIYLNKKPSSNQEVKSSDVFMSKEEKIRLWMAYGFAGVCLFILILVLLRNR